MKTLDIRRPTGSCNIRNTASIRRQVRLLIAAASAVPIAKAKTFAAMLISAEKLLYLVLLLGRWIPLMVVSEGEESGPTFNVASGGPGVCGTGTNQKSRMGHKVSKRPQRNWFQLQYPQLF